MTSYIRTMREAREEMLQSLNESNLEKMRKASKGAKQTLKMKDGSIGMDSFTASAIMQIYDKINDKNKKTMENLLKDGKKADIVKLMKFAMSKVNAEYVPEEFEEEFELDEKKQTAQYTDGGQEKITVTVDNMRNVNIDDVVAPKPGRSRKWKKIGKSEFDRARAALRDSTNEEVDFYEEIAELNALVEELDEGISQAIGRAGLAVAKTAGTAAKSAITKRLKRGPTAQLYRRAQAGIKKAKAVGSRIKQAAKTGQSYQSTAPVRKTKKPPKVKKAEYDPMLEKLEIIEFKLNHHCQTLEEEMKNESLKDAVIRVWQEAADAAVDPKEREELDNAPEDTAKKMKRADEPTPAVSEALIDAVSEALTAKQKKIDVDGDGEIEGSDLAALRKKAAKKEGLEDSPNPANSQHLCAKNVVHEEWGAGECIPTMHADPDKNGHVAWYDVIFEHGLEMGVSINELKVTHEGHHENHKKNDKDKEMLRAKKEEQDLMDGGPSHRQIYRRQQGMDRYSKKALKRREKGKKTRGFTQASRDRRDQAADARVKHLKVKADRKAAKIQAKTAKKEEVELDEFVLEAVSMMWFANVALPVLIGGGLVVAGGIGLGVMKLISKLSSMKAALKDKRMQKFIKDNKGKKKLDASDKAELNSIVSPAEKKKLKSEVEDVVKKEEFRLAQDFKVQSMREALRKVWNIDEGELPPALKKAIDAKKKDKEEDHDPEHDKDKEKTLTGKKKAAVNVNPSLQAQKY